jgi:CRISPR system Cascade subunit CasE
MLYLSQLILNPRSPHARGDLADCRALHSRVLHAFPDREDITAARDHFGILYRLERHSGTARVLVQSRERPDWSRLPVGYLRQPAGEPKRVDDLYARIVPGQELRFRLRANPTKRVHERAIGLQNARFAGKRIELRSEADQLKWLARKGEAAGFALLHVGISSGADSVIVSSSIDDARDGDIPVVDVRTTGTAAKVVRYLPGRKLDLAFGSVVFEGRLRVTDVEEFRRTLADGIGSGKAFGFGLLSVAPATSIALQ